MFIDIRNLQERRQQRDSQFEDTRDIRNGYLFEVNGSVEGDRDGLVWFKALDGNSEPFQVFYGGVIGDLRANMFVKIERNPKSPARWQVIEFDTGIYFDDQSSYEQLPSLSAIPTKESYEWPPGFPGAKALNIFPRAITDFAVRPTSPASMKARVYSGIYPGATNYARFQGPVNTKDFTADVPGAGLARLAAISIDNTGTLNYTNGTTFVDGLPMPDASLPVVPASQMLISAIRLVNGMTAIKENNFDLEMRPLMANGTVNIKVAEIWESDFGDVALQADADGDIGVGISPTSVAKFQIRDASDPQLRLEFDATHFADFEVDTNHDLTIDPSSTGDIKLVADVTVTNLISHEGDPDTRWSFDTDKVSLTVGGLLMIEAVEIAVGQDALGLGDVGGGGDIDIDFNDGQIFLEGSSGFFGINKITSLISPFHIDANNTICERLTRLSTTDINQFRAMAVYLLETTQATADGLGPNFTFDIKGSDGTGTLAQIGAKRSGAINKGSISLACGTNGVEQMVLIDELGFMGVGRNVTPTAALHVDQIGTGRTVPVLLLDQADVSEEMIQFETTIGVGNAIEAVGAKTLTVTHFIKITLPGGLTRYIEVGTIA